MAAAPIITAMGGMNYYEQKVLNANLQKRRAVALLNLVKVLRDTEKERAEKNEYNDVLEEKRRVLRNHLDNL